MPSRGYRHSMRDQRGVAITLTEEELEELHETARRLDRSISWVVQEAWRLAYPRLRKMHAPGGRKDAGH